MEMKLTHKNITFSSNKINYILSEKKSNVIFSEVDKIQLIEKGRHLTKLELLKNMIEIGMGRTYPKIKTVSELLNDNIKTKQKQHQYIKLFNKDEKFLEKKIKDLSHSELVYLELMLCLSSKPKVIILNQINQILDLKNESYILGFLEKLSKKDKIVIYITNKITDNFYDQKILRYEKDFEQLENIVQAPNLDKYYLPFSISLNRHVLKEKGIKLPVRNCVEDIMKDIFRNIKIKVFK